MLKKWIAGALVLSMCLSAAACNDADTSTSDSSDTTASQTTETTSSDTTATTQSSQTTETTETTDSTGETPVVDPNIKTTADLADIESIKIGNHVTLRYNAQSADVTYETKRGIGTKETVTLTVTMKNDYTFNGWSLGDAIVNGTAIASTKETYSIDVSAATTVYLNTSITLRYHENGGKRVKGTGTETYSVVFYQNPNTLPEQGYFTRDGYTLVGYNTKEDGTGEFASLGSKINPYGKGVIDLWCVWAEHTPTSEFEYKEQNGGITITGYKGNAATVSIPSKIDGKTVKTIASSAFASKNIEHIVIPKTVTSIKDSAFKNCVFLKTATLFDTATELKDNIFSGCSALETVYLNTVYTLNTDWTACGAAKFDRLIWAKDKKKLIIIGGSGSLYGFDSSIIDEALDGEYEIINLGENANITSLMYFDVVEDFVGEGDIVLWCPEPGGQTLGSYYCGNRFWEFRKSDYGFAKYLNTAYYQNFFSSFASYSNSLKNSKFQAFDRLSKDMNKYGDHMNARITKNQLFTNYRFHYQMEAQFVMMEVIGNITAKGARVLYSPAAMQEGGLAIAQAKESDIQNFINIILSVPGVEQISDYKNRVYPNEYFYDSEWHLTNEGAKVRATHVAEDLRKALGK